MPDVFDPEKRSWIMSRVRGKDTKPERIVRSALHRTGYRFRLHDKKLPGSPDIVLRRHKKVVFVNGCFWHGHKGCKRSKLPSTNVEFWTEKIGKNKERDRKAYKALKKDGWGVLIVWECQTNNEEKLECMLRNFMEA